MLPLWIQQYLQFKHEEKETWRRLPSGGTERVGSWYQRLFREVIVDMRGHRPVAEISEEDARSKFLGGVTVWGGDHVGRGNCLSGSEQELVF